MGGYFRSAPNTNRPKVKKSEIGLHPSVSVLCGMGKVASAQDHVGRKRHPWHEAVRYREESLHMKRILQIVLLTTTWSSLAQSPSLKIEQVMTALELQQTGVSTLSVQQRDALNRWLLNYTIRILSTAQATNQQPASAQPRATGSTCAPAIEATISGEFHGWDGDTIFKLDNGQIWQQAAYDYTYSYSYRPDVTIYQTTAGCRMKVEDEEETILVKRIK
jgi:hypothetical protein